MTQEQYWMSPHPGGVMLMIQVVQCAELQLGMRYCANQMVINLAHFLIRTKSEFQWGSFLASVNTLVRGRVRTWNQDCLTPEFLSHSLAYIRCLPLPSGSLSLPEPVIALPRCLDWCLWKTWLSSGKVCSMLNVAKQSHSFPSFQLRFSAFVCPLASFSLPGQLWDGSVKESSGRKTYFWLRVQYETTFSVAQKHVSSLVQCH